MLKEYSHNKINTTGVAKDIYLNP